MGGNRPIRRRASIARASIYYLLPMATSLIQLISLILASLALVMGAWLLIVGRGRGRGGESQQVAPRVRLLGLSYMLVFGSAMIQIILQPRGVEGELLGGHMARGGAVGVIHGV